jgi:hypothetical protein
MLSRKPLNEICPAAFTLAEVIVSLTVGAILILLISSVAVRQQRFASGMSDLLATSAAVRDAAAILPVDLRSVDPAQGDIPAGEARDTSIQFRSTVATAVVCDTIAGSLILAPSAMGAPAFTSTLLSPQANDTAWFIVVDSTETWEAHVISSVGSSGGGQCASGGPVLTGSALTSARLSLRLTPAVASSAIGLPLRITRPLRYSLYKSSDGLWYLGQRDWNSSTQKLNTIQPVSGPLLPPGSLPGMSLSYADSNGVAIPSGSSNSRGIASMRMVFRSQTIHTVQIPGLATAANGTRLDSSEAVVAFRNRS